MIPSAFHPEEDTFAIRALAAAHHVGAHVVRVPVRPPPAHGCCARRATARRPANWRDGPSRSPRPCAHEESTLRWRGPRTGRKRRLRPAWPTLPPGHRTCRWQDYDHHGLRGNSNVLRMLLAVNPRPSSKWPLPSRLAERCRRRAEPPGGRRTMRRDREGGVSVRRAPPRPPRRAITAGRRAQASRTVLLTRSSSVRSCALSSGPRPSVMWRSMSAITWSAARSASRPASVRCSSCTCR